MNKLLNPSMIVALVALFVALGGTSYAVSQLPKNSVGTKQIKNNAVTSPKVKDGSLLADDFASGQLPKGERGLPGEQGPRGEQGERGVAGAKGDTGAAGPSETILRRRAGAVNISRFSNEPATILTASNVPAGNYLVVYRGDILNWNNQGNAFGQDDNFFRCSIKADGNNVAGATTSALQDKTAAQMVIADTLSLTSAATLTVVCQHDRTYTVNEPQVENSRLILVKVGSLDSADVTS